LTTLDIQRRLAALGLDPGPIDGVRGRLTIRAIKAFQAKSGLEADGIVGPATAAVLNRTTSHDPSPSPSPQGGGESLLPWYEEALRLKGTKEAAGAADNSTILRWARRLGLAYGHDSIAWCGLFTAHCIGAALPDEPLPTNPLGARNWQRFGVPTEPTLGAVLVFWRTHKTKSFNGHVGFYAGEDDAAFHVLGGNQSDSVSIARVARARLLGARWPSTAPKPKGGATRVTGAGSLSTNEA
jgi:uncharacterized protein (TIGR02594 family)